MKSWNESEVLIDRKSKFQARCCAITSPQEVPVLLQELINGNKSVKKASHQHMYAWRTADIALKDSTNSTVVKTKGVAKKHRHSANVGRQREFKNLQQDCQDCGESGAGHGQHIGAGCPGERLRRQEGHFPGWVAASL